MARLSFLFASLLLFALAGCGGDPEPAVAPLVLEMPNGFPDFPAEERLTAEGVALGRKLFYDPILSGDSTQSCASCHVQGNGFSDVRRFSVGIRGKEGSRQAMALVNLAWLRKGLFWDGRSPDLAHQALLPVEDPLEMDASWPIIEQRLASKYAADFQKAYGKKKVTRELAADALRQFELTLISGNAKYDRFRKGEASFSEQEIRGWRLFFSEKAECFHCHGAPLFTDGLFHNNGLDKTLVDEGKYLATGNLLDRGLFRTPTLRNTAVTPPYMHDGRFQTLEEVLDHYSDHVATESPNLDPLVKPFGLSDQEKADLIAFLRTLTDSAFLKNEAFQSPF